MANLALAFDILARDRASATMDKVGKSSEGLGKKLSSVGKMGAVALATGIGVAAVGGVAALGGAMIQGVKDAAAYQTLAQKTAAVLKSTGDASRQSVKGIQDRASALESMSGVDETTIINGQNVLATFTSIKDGVGKGNDIFNQATTAALNLSTALGQDMQSSTVQLGKALNDPVKGITALSRVGVSFTAQQKEQIKTLVKSGNTMGAQKLILKELNKEFGGNAAAAGKGFEGSMARAKDAVQDAFRSIGMKLLPVITKLADYVAKHAGPWIDTLSRILGNIWTFAKPAFTALGNWFTGTGLPAIKAFGGWIKNELWPAIQKGYETIMPALKQAFAIVSGAFKSTGDDGGGFMNVLKTIGHVVTDILIPVLAWVIMKVLPPLAMAWRGQIEVTKLFWKAIQFLGGVVADVVKYMLRRFADFSDMIAGVFDSLSHVPGFGWAKTAADKMHGAADKARDLARAIDNIQKNVSIGVSFKATSGRIKVGNQNINVGMRAGGGPVSAYGAYAVGDNPDGSWNPTTELFVPKTPGHIYNQRQLAAMSAGGSSRMDLSEKSLQRLAAILSGVRTQAVLSSGSLDSAMARSLP